jgi:hypothetical protein
MPTHIAPATALVCILVLFAMSRSGAGQTKLDLSDIHATDGAINTFEKRLSVDSPEMRAIFTVFPAPSRVRLTFTYLGPTKEVSMLGNGEVRHQFGFKLHAQDPCNLVYVIWDFDHPSNLRVSVKSNPSASAWQECRDNGYHNLRPTETKELPAIKENEPHAFVIEADGTSLVAIVDGTVVWRGNNDIAPTLRGPAGLRSDNVRVLFDLEVN